MRDPEEALSAADRVIKNTYRTLMTRGQKGCFVFSVDPETNAWFKAQVDGSLQSAEDVRMVAEQTAPYDRSKG